MPEYTVERVILKRETFNVTADSPEDAQDRVVKLQVAVASSHIETDIQVSLAGQPKAKGKGKGVKGTRIPADWQPDVAYAKSKGMNDRQINVEAERFRLYWSNRPGQGATKLDWGKTWQTWCLTFCERAGIGPSAPPVPTAETMSDAQWNKALDLFWRTQRWHRDYGPEPGRPGCRVPKKLLPLGMPGQKAPPQTLDQMPAGPDDLFVR